MLEVAPKLVAERTLKGKDAVQLGVEYRADPELVAQLVVRCLETKADFNGWHYLLEHDHTSTHVIAVTNLAQQEASTVFKAAGRDWTKSTPVLEQLTSPEQMAVEWLASSFDSKQRLAINVATLKNRQHLERCMLYLERYRMTDAVTVHDSDTTLILIAEDVKRERRVALKLMADEAGWQREISMRAMQRAAQLSLHILELLDSFIDEKAKKCADPRPFVVVMPAAEMDLSNFLSHHRVAGKHACTQTCTHARTHAQTSQMEKRHICGRHQSGSDDWHRAAGWAACTVHAPVRLDTRRPQAKEY